MSAEQEVIRLRCQRAAIAEAQAVLEVLDYRDEAQALEDVISDLTGTIITAVAESKR